MKRREHDFSQLVESHKSTIYTICYMFADNSLQADDLFQEVLIRLWQGFDSFRGDSQVATWVWRVSLNTCISVERKERRHRSVRLDIKSDFFSDSSSENRQIKALHDRISRLQPIDRAIVLLWLESMSYEEIAAIVGISVKSLSVRLYRIKEQLKQMSNKSE